MNSLDHAAAKKRRMTFMIEQSDVAELEAIAEARRVSLAWVIRDAVKEYLGQQAPLLRSTRSSTQTRRARIG